MPDNLPNIKLEVNEWTDLYAISEIEVGKVLTIENIGVCDVYLAVQADEPTKPHDSYNVIQRENGINVQNNAGDSGAWAFCNSDGAKLSVSECLEDGFTNVTAAVLKTATGDLVSTDKPLPVSDYDNSHRGASNSIFGDRYVGTRTPTIAAQFQYGLRSDDAVVDIVGSGNTTIEDAMLKLNTGTDADGHVGIQGADYLRYIPGHEAYAFFTCVFAAPVAGLIQRIGLFDFDGGNGNGFFVGYNGLTFGITRRRAGIDTFAAVDVADIFPEDSGVFDPTKGNVYKISYGYLGFATIHFENLLPHGGLVETASIDYPNTSTETHIANTNIPLRAEMTNDGSVVDSQMLIGSVTAGIVDGGGEDPIARWFTFKSQVTSVVGGTTTLFHFRNKVTFFGITNKISTQLALITASTDGTKTVIWTIEKNPTETVAGTWADINTTDSVMEISIDTVSTPATGEEMLTWNMGKVDSFFEDVTEFVLKLRPNDTAAIRVLTTAPNDVALSFRWKELF